MTVETWLRQATNQLQAADIQTARLDCLVLLEDCSGRDRGYWLAHPELEIDPAVEAQLANLLTKRAQHLPLGYLRGKAEFYGREFMVGPGVLIPRPESETIIELLLELVRQPEDTTTSFQNDSVWQIADVGAGSGALGITAALELPNTKVELLEIDDAAIAIAKTNVINYSTPLPVIKSNLLESATHPYDILLCNLPYVPDGYSINRAAAHEPPLAIFGGADGLDLYRSLFDQIKILEQPPLYILSEALPASHGALAEIAEQAGYRLLKTSDFIQEFVFKK